MDTSAFSQSDNLENTLLKIKTMPELKDKALCFMLIGLPASGKSTISNQIIQIFPEIIHKDLDSIIIKKAKSEGKTYHEINLNTKLKDRCAAQLSQDINTLIKDKTPFIWEQLNIAKGSRITKAIRVKKDVARNKGNGEIIKESHTLIGIYTNIPLDVLKKRLHDRNQEGRSTGEDKFISLKTLTNISPEYTFPQEHEPFDLLFECNSEFNLTLKPSKPYEKTLAEKKNNRPSDEEIERRRAEKNNNNKFRK